MAPIDHNEQPAFTAWLADREPDEQLNQRAAAYSEARRKLETEQKRREELQERLAHRRADVHEAEGKARERALQDIGYIQIEIEVLPDMVAMLARHKAEAELEYLHDVYLAARRDVRAISAELNTKGEPVWKKAKRLEAYMHAPGLNGMTEQEASTLRAEIDCEGAETLQPLRARLARAEEAYRCAQAIAERYGEVRLEGREGWHLAIEGYAKRMAAAVKLSPAGAR